MRISIWQQFSSNHSGNFELVGFFVQPERAQEASRYLQKLLKEIAIAREKSELGDRERPTDVELEYSKQLKIDWKDRSIDWVILNGDRVRNVDAYNEYVFMSNIQGDNSWANAYVVSEILEKFGATVCISGEFHLGRFIVFITCKVDREIDATLLQGTLNDYLEGRSPLIPWINFWTGLNQSADHLLQPDLSELHAIFVEQEQRAEEFKSQNAVKLKQFDDESRIAYESGELLLARRLQAERAVFLAEFQKTLPDLSNENGMAVFEAQSELTASGTASLQDGLLTINLAWMRRVEQVVPALIKYLESKGGTEIDCEVHYVMK